MEYDTAYFFGIQEYMYTLLERKSLYNIDNPSPL